MTKITYIINECDEKEKRCADVVIIKCLCFNANNAPLLPSNSNEYPIDGFFLFQSRNLSSFVASARVETGVN